MRSSETSVHVRFTLHYIPEYGSVYSYRCENIKSYYVLSISLQMVVLNCCHVVFVISVHNIKPTHRHSYHTWSRVEVALVSLYNAYCVWRHNNIEMSVTSCGVTWSRYYCLDHESVILWTSDPILSYFIIVIVFHSCNLNRELMHAWICKGPG
jgi:hypothetical protein